MDGNKPIHTESRQIPPRARVTPPPFPLQGHSQRNTPAEAATRPFRCKGATSPRIDPLRPVPGPRGGLSAAWVQISGPRLSPMAISAPSALNRGQSGVIPVFGARDGVGSSALRAAPPPPAGGLRPLGATSSTACGADRARCRSGRGGGEASTGARADSRSAEPGLRGHRRA